MKQEFIDFLNALMEAAPEVVEKLMTDNVRAYIEAMMESKPEKPILTENGKLILKYLQEHSAAAGVTLFKAKDVADQLYVSSRKVSGAMRKLVADGFVDKVADTPTLYTITEKGKEIQIEE